MSTVRLIPKKGGGAKATAASLARQSTPAGGPDGKRGEETSAVGASSSSAASLPDFQLGEVLGRGAFGCVFRALKWTTGETVAVKQISLGSIPRSELPEIMSEIDLLKNLDHPNIVQYRGFVKTRDYLYIILEYCENGSLHTILKKFGKFPESLVAVYICQVLEGLLYLHEQGVIHRDIKGSNILATKEGGVKLADFGVATQAGGLADNAVVGSPYWMAPEVVDQSGATTASDIWSVGCVVIELLEGKPPYHFLDPMPALFRIVNDDCPPLPDSASPVARDFLLQCFQKDQNLRISAKKLLKHPWMVAARKRVEQKEREQALAQGRRTPAGGHSGREDTRTGYDETVQRVQDWNKALENERVPKPDHSVVSPSHNTSAGTANDDAPNTLATHNKARVGSRILLGGAMAPKASGSATIVPQSYNSPKPTASALARNGHVPSLVNATLPTVIAAPSKTLASVGVETQGDNWDDDFEEGISSSKIAALDSEVESRADRGTTPGREDNTATIRPQPSPTSQSPTTSLASIVEDYSDLVDDDQKDPFEGRVANLKMLNQQQKILHPKDIGSPALADIARPASPSAMPMRSASPAPPFTRHRVAAPGRNFSPASPLSDDPLNKFSEEGGEDYSDLFAKPNLGQNGKSTETLQLTAKLSSKSWLGDEDSDEEDPFAEVEEDLTEEPTLEANMAREKLSRLSTFVNELVDGMTPDVDEFTLREGCLQLVGMFEEEPATRVHFVRCHGMLAVIELLQQFQRSRDLVSLLLRIVNLIITDDPESLEKICYNGGCPVVMGFASNKYAREIRLEAALFIGSMCQTSLLTLQMFISCRGLKVLVEMMDENYDEQKDLVWMAVDGICRVFELQGPTPRNDFCRMFANEGLLEPLSEALLHVSGDDDDLAENAKSRIVHVFLLFSQADMRVKESMLVRSVVLRLIRSLSILDLELLATMLKTIKNLTMLPSGLVVLQNANAIEVLTRTLREQYERVQDNPFATDIANHVVNALYNLCRLSKPRQEEAALAGAIPVLQAVVASSSPLKQFALPILCDFAHTSKTCRKLLWQRDGFTFYLGLLRDPFWGVTALESILTWLSDETARVEDALVEPSSVEALLKMFTKAKASSFENLLDPLMKLFRLSARVANNMASQPAFFRRLVDRLTGHNKAVVRLNLLRLTKVVYESATEKANVIGQAGLVSAVVRMADADSAILVRELAKELSREFSHGATKPSISDAPSRASRVSSILRRTQSDLVTQPGRGGGSSSPTPRVDGGLFSRVVRRNSALKKPVARS